MSIIVISERRNRQTGTAVQLIDNRDGSFDSEDLPWITHCDDHGNYCSHPTRALATWWMASPRTWCEDCRARKICPVCRTQLDWSGDMYCCPGCGQEWHEDHFREQP